MIIMLIDLYNDSVYDHRIFTRIKLLRIIILTFLMLMRTITNMQMTIHYDETEIMAMDWNIILTLLSFFGAANDSPMILTCRNDKPFIFIRTEEGE